MGAKLDVVVGAQYGSEAKGHLVADLAARRMKEGLNPLVVRVAGPNAGHTGYDHNGKPWALRSVPVAAVVPGTITWRWHPEASWIQRFSWTSSTASTRRG